MLACGESWTLDGQAGMSKEGDSPDYEYWRRLREHKVRSNRLSWMVMSAPADMSVYYANYLKTDTSKKADCIKFAECALMIPGFMEKYIN